VFHVQAAVDELDAETVETGEFRLGHRDERLLARRNVPKLEWTMRSRR
jgi:hypothetical protein